MLPGPGPPCFNLMYISLYVNNFKIAGFAAAILPGQWLLLVILAPQTANDARMKTLLLVQSRHPVEFPTTLGDLSSSPSDDTIAGREAQGRLEAVTAHKSAKRHSLQFWPAGLPSSQKGPRYHDFPSAWQILQRCPKLPAHLIVSSIPFITSLYQYHSWLRSQSTTNLT